MTGSDDSARPTGQEARFPRGLVVRLVVYFVVGHLLAGFIWLLFEIGSSRM